MTCKQDRDGWAGWPEQRPGASTNGTASPAFTSLTDTLSEARRSANDLMLVAQNTERKLKARLEESAKQTSSQLLEAERTLKARWRDGARATSSRLQRRIERLQRLETSLRAGPVVDRALARHLSSLAEDSPKKPRQAAVSGMRKVRSDSDFQRMQSSDIGDTADTEQPGSAPAPRGKPRARTAAPDWDVFAALNGSLGAKGAARRMAPGRSMPSLQDQLRAGPGGEAARALLEAPRRTLRTCQRTLENCSENLQTLGQLLQQSVAASQFSATAPSRRVGAAAAARIPPPGTAKPRRPPGSHNTAFVACREAVVSPGFPSLQVDLIAAEELLRLEEGSSAGRDGAGGTENPLDALRQAFERMVRAHHEAALERALREDAATDEAEAAGHPPFGPLQAQALKRRRDAARRRLSSLREPGRRVAIYTTASLPWMTGTAVNPLLRAAYLARDPNREVTLVIPWLAAADQEMVFPNNQSFETPEAQEQFVRAWARKRTGMPCNFKIKFYPGRYAAEKCSILPVGDPTLYIPDNEADVAVLEEPEHLTWYHHGRRWTDKFPHVVGVIHTNYLDYARREVHGELKAAVLAAFNRLVCRLHCHKVVKLSDAVQRLPRQQTQFVHGVPESFLEVGRARAAPPASADGRRFGKGAYFIGKAIWAKGYTELLALMDADQTRAGDAGAVHVDCYGSGEDLEEMRILAEKKHLALHFHGPRDHLDTSIHEYQVFVNPSTSDVVATTTAEALAMGKWVVVADLPCNAFFKSFSNCLTYRTPEEFGAQLRHALAAEPVPMAPEERQRLTWEAATERFLDVAELTERERPRGATAALEAAVYAAVNTLSGMEALRTMGGAGQGTRDNPVSLMDYAPDPADSGGIFDNKERAAAHLQQDARICTQETIYRAALNCSEAGGPKLFTSVLASRITRQITQT
ncbi:hypothetical protein WJX81_001802 [Elliptochloris bilobata]|uniref:Digalactosyldiacylglycerol synthase n=1 Tax=Elliptochloris bilobata TaxID=381761 RepID=A0AAW1R242_9CHLO